MADTRDKTDFANRRTLSPGSSLLSRAIRPIFAKQLEKRPKEGANLDLAREVLDSMGSRMRPPPGTTLADETIAGVPCERISPPTADDTTCILYLHGGGYLLGSRHSHRGLAGHLANAVGAQAVLAEYRLAPEHPFPAGLDDAVSVYQALLEEFDHRSILISGDSAGGGLSLATVMRLRDEDLPLPAGVALISPWTDLAGTGESLVTNAEVEIMLDPDRITEIADLYHPGTNAEFPYVSPLYGDFTGLPPLLIQVGDEEILLSDSIRVAERAEAAGVAVALRVWPRMWHVWHMFTPWMPDARRAVNEYARWALGVIGRG